MLQLLLCAFILNTYPMKNPLLLILGHFSYAMQCEFVPSKSYSVTCQITLKFLFSRILGCLVDNF